MGTGEKLLKAATILQHLDGMIEFFLSAIWHGMAWISWIQIRRIFEHSSGKLTGQLAQVNRMGMTEIETGLELSHKIHVTNTSHPPQKGLPHKVMVKRCKTKDNTSKR